MDEARTSRHALLFIFITMLIDMIGLGIVIPVMPKIIVSLIGGTLGDAAPYGGWLFDAYAIMQFLFAPLIGNLSDRFGRRPVLIVALVALGIDYTITGLAPTIGWLFIGRLLSGAAGGSYATVNAYVADISPPEKRAANFGLIGAAFGLGFIIGPLVGGYFGQFGPRLPFFISAGLAFANALYGFVVLKETLPKENRRKLELSRANPFGAVVGADAFSASGPAVRASSCSCNSRTMPILRCGPITRWRNSTGRFRKCPTRWSPWASWVSSSPPSSRVTSCNGSAKPARSISDS